MRYTKDWEIIEAKYKTEVIYIVVNKYHSALAYDTFDYAYDAGKTLYGKDSYQGKTV